MSKAPIYIVEGRVGFKDGLPGSRKFVSVAMTSREAKRFIKASLIPARIFKVEAIEVDPIQEFGE